MKSSFIIILVLSIVLYSCKKSDNPSGSGTVTITNTLEGNDQTGYYSFGFLFSQAKKVSTTEVPGPDVLVYVNPGTSPASLTLQANNLNPSFYKIGDYPDAQSAATAFNNLKTVGTYNWVEMADPVASNQVWVYRTQSGCYAKIRIISAVIDNTKNPVYGECTFEWVYQPDGSTTFPAK
jgi:hypothetical protein